MSKHVFVSHSHKDSATAQSVVAALEARGISCWVAPRDVDPGGSYAESILNAIEGASCFVLIYSEHSNVSSHVLREVERALKFGVNIVPVRFDDSTPSKSLDYLLATVHWLAIPADSRERAIVTAAEQIAEWLTKFEVASSSEKPTGPRPVTMPLFGSIEAAPKRNLSWVLIALVLALTAGGGFAVTHVMLVRNLVHNALERHAAAGQPQPAIMRLPTPEPFERIDHPVSSVLSYRPIDDAQTNYALTVAPAQAQNNPANRPPPPPQGGAQMNNNGAYPLPPPPPPPEWQNNPPNGMYPPPPPPGRNGPGRGMPQNPGGPHP
jgi:hypothetical protein